MDQPSMRELVEAVRDFIENKAMPELKGHTAFHARVAANALGIVARELEHGPQSAQDEKARAGGAARSRWNVGGIEPRTLRAHPLGCVHAGDTRPRRAPDRYDAREGSDRPAGLFRIEARLSASTASASPSAHATSGPSHTGAVGCG